VTSLGRRFRRPVFLQLRVLWGRPFVDLLNILACSRALLTKARLMPCALAISVSDIFRPRSRMMAARSMFSGGRPIWQPSSLALRMPAQTRSMMRPRSSSATTPMISIIAKASMVWPVCGGTDPRSKLLRNVTYRPKHAPQAPKIPDIV
jgi:hypothetical protein